jgi:hypothetical protein
LWEAASRVRAAGCAIGWNFARVEIRDNIAKFTGWRHAHFTPETTENVGLLYGAHDELAELWRTRVSVRQSWLIVVS